nr:proline-rich protein HaeIII subfamily 1-like [Aegilops tauschii subsp. strangulata]
MAPPAPCCSSPLPRLPEATKQTHPAASPPRPRWGPKGPDLGRAGAARPRRRVAPPPTATPRTRSTPPLAPGAPAAALDRHRLEAPLGVAPVPRRWTPERGKARGPPPPASPGPGPQRAPATAAGRKGEGELRGGGGWTRLAARGGDTVAGEEKDQVTAPPRAVSS